MATYNTRIKKRNASNTGWDSILPITTAENVLINEQGDTVATHMADDVQVTNTGQTEPPHGLPKCKYDATVAPTEDNDSSEGYAVGSKWIDTTHAKIYECVDATGGAAVWQENGVASVDTTDIPRATTANATYYVATTGSDENDGLSSDKAFKTINKALNLIPQIVNHIITINIADGSYNEAITLRGKLGGGKIVFKPAGTGVILTGYTNAVTSSIDKAAIVVEKCYCSISIINKPIVIKPSGNLGSSPFVGLDILSSITTPNWFMISINGNDITTSGEKKGIVVHSSITYLYSCAISKCHQAITALYHAKVHSYNNTGSNDVSGTALYALRGATISKEGTQPTGATNELTEKGGVIR